MKEELTRDNAFRVSTDSLRMAHKAYTRGLFSKKDLSDAIDRIVQNACGAVGIFTSDIELIEEFANSIRRMNKIKIKPVNRKQGFEI